MNILQYPEEETKSMNKNDSFTQLQLWNNAAFDSEDDFAMKISSWSSDCTKENMSPAAPNNSSSIPVVAKLNNKNHSHRRNIDDEIAEIECEITRLTSRLEALRLEKAQQKSAAPEKPGGRIVAAKFMEPKRNDAVSNHSTVVFKYDTPKRSSVVLKDDTQKRNAVVLKDQTYTPKRNAVVFKDDTPSNTNNKARVIKWRRGMSLGPAEIAGRLPPAITPATQVRRKSCLWKINEEERRKTVARTNSIASVGSSMKSVKKKEEDLVQPKKLFKESEVEKSSNKKVLKQGRVVASRYGGGNSGAVRKRSLPENRGGGGGSEVRVKKRWEIPAENVDVDVSGVVLLPKIRTLRCVNGVDESPRDSGAAKRVAELNGKRSYFCPDQVEGSVCQVLSFAEEG